MRKTQLLADALARVAREAMPPAEAARFVADVARVLKTRPARSPKDLEREQLLARHCPATLPPITLDRPSRPLKGRRRRRHTWSKPKPKQLLLL